MVDITDLKSVEIRLLPVQVRPRVPLLKVAVYREGAIMKIIDGKKLSSQVDQASKRAISALLEKHITPKLAVILVGNDPASHVYVNNKIRSAQTLGIEIISHILPEHTTQTELLDIISNHNMLDTNGILLQQPLPAHLDTNYITNRITYTKDVDGFTIYNVGLLNSWMPCLEPSTPNGALMLIKSVLGSDLSGKKAVVLGRSLIVGRPMCSILIRESCTVTLLHSKSTNIGEECRNADIVVSAIGKPGIIKSEYIKDGACVIDIGITRVEGKLYGDVDFDNMKDRNIYITPVPGGAGPMTVACMLNNTVRACFNQNGLDFSEYEISF